MEEEREGETESIFLSQGEAIPNPITKIIHCTHLNGNAGTRCDPMSSSSSVLSHEKILCENESIDEILSVEKDHVFKKPQMLFPIIFLLE